MTEYRVTTEKTWSQTHKELATEFDRWGRLRRKAVSWSVENMRGQALVILRYRHAGEPEVELKMGRQRRAEDNLRVLYLAVEALRLNELRGIADVVREAYLALPAPVVERDPYEVLGIRSDAPPELAHGAYRALAKLYHPDNGTSPDAAKMAAVNAAYAALTKEVTG